MSWHTLPCRVIPGMNRQEYVALRTELVDHQLGLCVYCSCQLPYPQGQWDRVRATVDHVTPRTDGGTSDRENLVAACYSCNSSKSNQPLLVFLARKKWKHG